MAYSDLGLTSESYQQLTASRKRTALRLKVLKAAGRKRLAPAGAESLNVYNWNNDPAYCSAPTTEDDTYGKIVYCEKTNRTFILHGTASNRRKTDEACVVSIINHDLKTSDAGFIERVDHTVSPAWPADSRTIYDMAYNPNTQKLALAVSGAAPPEVPTPGLWVIDVNKYTYAIETNECSVLKGNPDYLAVEFWTDEAVGSTKVGCVGDYHEYVGCYLDKFWVMNYVTYTPYGGTYRQFGYYSGSDEFHILRHLGQAPGQTNHNNLDELFHPYVCWPWAAPRTDDSFSHRGDNLYIGDPFSLGYKSDLCAFDLDEETGLLALSFVPTGAGPNPPRFGIESSVFVFDLNKYEQDLEVIGAGDLNREAYESEPGVWRVDSDLVKTTIPLLEKPADGWTQIVFTFATQNNESYISVSDYGLIQTDYGLAFALNDNHPDQQDVSRGNTTVYLRASGAIDIGVYFAGGTHDDRWTLLTAFAAYRDPMIVAAFNQDTIGDWYLPADTVRPETGEWTDAYGNDWQLAKYKDTTPLYTQVRTARATARKSARRDDRSPSAYNLLASMYLSSANYGLWWGRCSDDPGACEVTQFLSSNSALFGNYVGGIYLAGGGAMIFSSNAGLATDARIQFMDISGGAGVFSPDAFTPALAIKSKNYSAKQLLYSQKRRVLGILFSSSAASEVQCWRPGAEAVGWVRDPRVWWNGSGPDITIGDDSAGPGRDIRIRNLSFSQNKGETSYSLSFSTAGRDCLPWAESAINENPDFPGSFDGALQDGSRLILERGVWDGRSWTWIPEGQFFVDDLPVSLASGFADMTVSAGGPISLLATRAVYKGYHEPQFTSYKDVPLFTADGLVYYLNALGGPLTDWRIDPPPVIKVDAIETTAYTIDTAAGTVTFPQEPAGAVTATFMAWDPGTNEAEDLLLCILTYPNALGGPGLDLSYLTRKVTGESLVNEGNGFYSFARNMVISDHEETKVYKNGVLQTPGPDADYVWVDPALVAGEAVSRSGGIRFIYPPSVPVTADYVHFTVQKSGVTLKPINLTVREYKDAYDCINAVLRRVAPNYILKEARDGKIECDYFTQKPDGMEDIEIADDQIVIRSLSDNPVYEDIATRVVSLGQADLLELPNLCLGKTVTDELSFTNIRASSNSATFDAWNNSHDVAKVTDGDPATGALGGWGNDWGDISEFFLDHAPDGVPMLTIDLEDLHEVHTIIVARPSGPAGELPHQIQAMSILASATGGPLASEWARIVNPFSIRCGANAHFKAGASGCWPEGYKFRYLRLNLHSFSLYPNSGGRLDSLFSISEVQAYPPDIIEGVATLQTFDASAPLYDSRDLLAKYGFLTKIARNGAPDPALRSQAACDLDARFVLEELVRLMRQEQIEAPWLPGIPIYSTIKITNSLLGCSRSFFIENRSFSSGSGDTYSGVTLP